MKKIECTNPTLVIFTGGMGVGGLEKMSRLIGDRYISRGYKVIIVALLYPEITPGLDPRIEVRFFSKTAIVSKKWKYILKWIRYIKTILLEEKPRLVLAHTFRIGALVSAACQKFTTRLTIREAYDPNIPGRSKMERKLCDFVCKRADGIIYQTTWEQKCHSKGLLRKSMVIPNPCSSEARALSTKTKRIVACGRIDEKQKKLTELIKAFSLFRKTHDDYFLDFYGDGPDLDFLKNFVISQELQEKIHFMGSKKNALSLFLDATMFVISSSYEGMSNSLLEAFLAGIPCISSDWGGVEDIILEGENGFLYRRGSPEELAKKMAILADSPDLQEKFSRNAEIQRKKYDPSAVLDAYECVISPHFSK